MSTHVSRIQIIPNLPRKPYIQPANRGAKAMTIAVGLLASDGIVLCSDSQLTIPQYMKFQDRKIFWLESKPAGLWAIGLAYSGDPERMGRIRDIMQEKTEGQQHIDKSFVKSAFGKKLDNLKGAIALHFAHYNFVRVHQTLRTTPAMAAQLTDHLWSFEELIDAVSNSN